MEKAKVYFIKAITPENVVKVFKELNIMMVRVTQQKNMKNYLRNTNGASILM